ncbi:PAS domain-containing protein [Pseudodesulfovibrio sp. JC047]|uniref:PAS domain-containing protein n=1 Tax=Pseudodesulfovibrio sp. JC047 TaxID=2683199 RepID=UPI0013D0A826|nr:PAS domain-containing protein [Pseudodesulfovibrio sp. JC047]
METIQFEKWDTYLVYEHELIERAMAVLKHNLEGLESGKYDATQLTRALDFLLEFGDKVHNKKEEDHLFPLMNQLGIPIEGGPIGVMLMEHEAERKLLARMILNVPNITNFTAERRQQFKQEGLDYLQIRAEHIWKENDVLYAMGRKIIQDDAATQLVEAFNAVDDAAYGYAAKGNYLSMVEEMESADTIRTRLVENLTTDQLHGILETLPFELTFVDAKDTVAYFNKLDKPKVFARTRSVVGRKVQKCHPEKSVDTVQKIVEGFKNKTHDKAEFWINMGDETIMIRYFPVFDDTGQYLGVCEVTQEVGWIRRLEGEQRLLDW